MVWLWAFPSMEFDWRYIVLFRSLQRGKGFLDLLPREFAYFWDIRLLHFQRPCRSCVPCAKDRSRDYRHQMTIKRQSFQNWFWISEKENQSREVTNQKLRWRGQLDIKIGSCFIAHCQKRARPLLCPEFLISHLSMYYNWSSSQNVILSFADIFDFELERAFVKFCARLGSIRLSKPMSMWFW